MEKLKDIISKHSFDQYLLYTLGIVFMPLGVVLTLRSELGAGGYDSLNFAIADRLHINVSVAIWLTAVMVLIITVVIRHSRLRITTFVSSIFLGFSTDAWNGILHALHVRGIVLRIILLLIGIIIISIAVAAYILSGFPCNPTDDLVVALNERGIPLGAGKFGFDCLCVILSYLSGGSVGIGTVLCTVLIGPCVQIVSRLLRRITKI